jgi:hypothetical protein
MLAPELAKRLRRLQESHPFFLVARAWMKMMATRPDSELQVKEQQCRLAIKLAAHVSGTSLDARWTTACANRTESELSKLRNQAQIVVGRPPRWWDFLNVRRWSAKYAIEKVRRRTADVSAKEAGKTLLAHLNALLARVQLARINEELLPKIPLKPDEANQVKTPRTAM